MPSIFILGATGYIGGAVLVALKQSYPTFVITALVRNPEHNDAILAAGATNVINPPSDKTDEQLALLEASAANTDVIVNCSAIRELEPVKAMLRGLKKRFESGKGRGIYITTSGSAVFKDGRTDGKFNPDGHIHSDLNEDDMKAIPSAITLGSLKWDRPEVLLLKAAEEGYIQNYTVFPAAVVGVSAGPLGKVGMLVHIISTVKGLGFPFYIGEGTSIGGAVDITDLAELYVLILKKALADQPLATLPEGPYARYYVASITDYTNKEFIRIMGEVLFKHGLIKSADSKQVTVDQAGFFGPFFGGNVRVKSERGIHDLGWKPREVTQQMIVDIVEESLKA